MNKKQNKAEPGDGLRSLRSTMMFRAVNYELYAKPNKVVMIFGAATMLSCVGYILYMRQKYDSTQYYNAITEDGSVVLEKKTSKWVD
ncbi:small integral membrane protein 8 [Megalopta genalis]|uniref:small integral membrane protein 8 n=1 Tax=Megalopta genalis TaxID=115081 RepID=UPI00144312BF|nr:small integral membrane protein 8 [Megalopta genalis]XP_033324983.1 small integral membrane protein 8 [Megalopta genalis]XP_033324985.1 small integral membrane protein 8 [Megalopta genalis]XP_033324986.1 small integral membrane protein 8 [Megalopta genalis]